MLDVEPVHSLFVYHVCGWINFNSGRFNVIVGVFYNSVLHLKHEILTLFNFNQSKPAEVHVSFCFSLNLSASHLSVLKLRKSARHISSFNARIHMTGSIKRADEEIITILALLVIWADRGASSSVICFPLKNSGSEFIRLSNKNFSWTLSFSCKFTLNCAKVSPCL